MQRGVKLGGFKGVAVDPKLGTQALIAKADERARGYALVISDIRAEGVSTFTGIAAEMNDRGITGPRGGSWQAAQVKRVVERAQRIAI